MVRLFNPPEDGVTSINNLTGDVILAAGTNVTLGTVGNTITINASGGGGGGTVTSVAMSVPTGLTITGSPVTTTGTLAVALDTGYVIPLQTTLDGYVKTDQTVGQTIGATGARLTKLWATDVTVTNAITGSVTGNAGTATALATPRTIGTVTGDVTSAGSAFDGSANNTNALTLATVNANVGSFGSTTATSTFTVNAKGLITAAGSTTITPAVGSITGLGTGVATALAINVGSAGAFITNGGALGTPSSGTVTNLTGTASININGTVGATTPGTGAFTTLSTSSTATIGARLGVGVAADAARLLLVSGDVSGGVATINRSNASTNGILGTAIIKGTSTGDMADGFGTAFQFAIQDTAAVENIVGGISVVRDGADTKSKMFFNVANTGASEAFLQLTPTALSPATNDVLALGTTALQWSDIFLAEGGVINWDNGDLTLTQTGNSLELAGGELTLPNTGLHILDTNATHDLIIAPGSNLTADRTLTVTTGDTNMIVDFTAVTDEYVLAYDAGTNTWRGVAGGGGGGMTVGGAITSGTANRILYENSSNQLAESANFTYNGATLTVTAPSATDTPLVIKGATSQTGDYFQIQNSAGTVLSSFDDTRFYFGQNSARTAYLFGEYPGGGTVGSFGTVGGVRLDMYASLFFYRSPITVGGLGVSEIGAGNVPLSVYGSTSQTAHLQDWGNVGGTVLSFVASSGDLTVPRIFVNTSSSPTSGGTGTAGEITWDTNYIYVCTATNTWKRAALTGGY